MGISPSEMKSVYRRLICTAMCPAALFTTVKIWEELECPSIKG
jgi:hypothetical protein